MDKHDWTPQTAPLNEGGCSLYANCDSELWYQGVLFFIFMPRYTACGILVPEQGLNLGPGGGNVET